MMGELRKSPPYSEEQATNGWPGWRTTCMRRNQTIFLAGTGTSWLVEGRSAAPHLLLMHIFWGILSGLIGGLMIGLIGGLNNGLIFGLLAALIRTFRITLHGNNEHIRTVDSLQWSWQNARQNSRQGLLVG
ncbi:MAG: hypothetical protein R2911_03035 [Caldilineaceae bacterium]